MRCPAAGVRSPVAQLNPGQDARRQAPDVVDAAPGTIEVEHVEEDRCVRLAAGLHDGQGVVRSGIPLREELQADPEAEWRGAAAHAADGGRQGVHGHGRTHVVDHVHDRRPEDGGGAEARGLVGRVEHVGWEACPHVPASRSWADGAPGSAMVRASIMVTEMPASASRPWSAASVQPASAPGRRRRAAP